VEDQADHLQALMNLETQHEDLLGQLDELDMRVLSVLQSCQPARAETDCTGADYTGADYTGADNTGADNTGLISGCPDAPTS